mgnify:CR=1 FL=1
MCHAQCHICHAQLAHESASSQPVQGMSFYDWPGDDIQGLTCINQDLNVMDLEGSLHFYRDLLGFSVVWQPDAENIYLSSGCDNLALHRADDLARPPVISRSSPRSSAAAPRAGALSGVGSHAASTACTRPAPLSDPTRRVT